MNGRLDQVGGTTMGPHWTLLAVCIGLLCLAAPVPLISWAAGAVLTYEKRPPPPYACIPHEHDLTCGTGHFEPMVRPPLVTPPRWLYPETRSDLSRGRYISFLLAAGACCLPLMFIPALVRTWRPRSVVLDPNRVTVGGVSIPLHTVQKAHATADRRLLIETIDGVVLSDPFRENDATLECLVFEIRRLGLDASELAAELEAAAAINEAAEALASAARRG